MSNEFGPQIMETNYMMDAVEFLSLGKENSSQNELFVMYIVETVQ